MKRRRRAGDLGDTNQSVLVVMVAMLPSASPSRSVLWLL